MKASEHLGSILSDYALQAFDAIGLARNEDLVGSADALRTLLEARGWPVYEAAFDFDAMAGGIVFGRTSPLGVFAALVRRERARVPRDDELLTYDGQRLLPADGAEITGLWIDARGTIYHGYFADFAGDDDGEWVSPSYESYVTLLERYALQTEIEWSRETVLSAKRLCYTVEVQARLGPELAAALEIPTWPPATDRFAAVWRAGERLVVERPNVETNWPETDARFGTLDEVVAFWDLVERLKPGARVTWAGPTPELPRPGDSVLRRYNPNRSGRGPHEVTVYGEPGHLRVSNWHW